MNDEIKTVQVEVLEPNIDYTIDFTGLKAATIYEIFIVAGSNHPNFPDLLSSGAVVSLESSTKDPSDDGSNNWAGLSIRPTGMLTLLLMMTTYICL